MTAAKHAKVEAEIEARAEANERDAKRDKQIAAARAAEDTTAVYIAAAKDILAVYGRSVAEEVIVARTGATKQQAHHAVTTAILGGATCALDIEKDPKYRFDERVENLVKKGTPKKDAENNVRWVILQKELPPVVRLAPANTEVELRTLAPGQHFSTDTSDARAAKKNGWPVQPRKGVLVSTSPASCVVLMTGAKPETRTIKRKSGEEITFTSAGQQRTRMAPETVVTALAESENLALLFADNGVESKSGRSIQDQTGEVMAKAKKAAKKAASTNGEAKHTRYENTTFTLVSSKIDDKLQKQLDNEEKNSHGVVVLRAIKAARKALKLDEIISLVKATKKYKTEGNPDGLIQGDVRILTEKGILNAKEA